MTVVNRVSEFYWSYERNEETSCYSSDRTRRHQSMLNLYRSWRWTCRSQKFRFELRWFADMSAREVNGQGNRSNSTGYSGSDPVKRALLVLLLHVGYNYTFDQDCGDSMGALSRLDETLVPLESYRRTHTDICLQSDHSPVLTKLKFQESSPSFT